MGTVLASDIPGSSLTIAFQNSQQDAATRKFVVSSTSRSDAITTVTSALGSTSHPNESNLKVNQVTAQSVGPSRWLVTVQYVRGKIGGFPSVNLCNMRLSSEACQVYCTPATFFNGLPWGNGGNEFVNPGADLNTNPQSRPAPWVYNRPVINIQIPFSSTTNPVEDKVGNVSKVNSSVFTEGGLSLAKGTVRFDGAEIRSVGPSAGGAAVRYYGTESYTFAQGGWWKQVLEYDQTKEVWKANNIEMYDEAS